MPKVPPVPPGHHTATPYLVLDDAAAAIDFYREAFGAEELFRMPGPAGHGVMHAEIQIGDSVVMLCDESPQQPAQKSPRSAGTTTASILLYVPDVDASHRRAERAGATTALPPTDMFWGDRMAAVSDPFGHQWSIATHVKDLSPEEMAAAAAQAMG